MSVSVTLPKNNGKRKIRMFMNLIVFLFLLCTLDYVSPSYEGKIVNGIRALPGFWQFIVGISARTVKGRIECSGTILTSNYILTAAHCLNQTPDSIRIVASRDNISDPDYEFTVAEFIFHPKYESEKIVNDIALIRLNDFIDFCRLIDFKCVDRPSKDLKIIPNKCIVMGWGSLRYDIRKSTDRLRELVVPILDNKYCHQVDAEFDPESTLCAGYIKGGRDHCHGDSGGPLMCPVLVGQNSYRFVQYGIVSYGFRCAAPWQPGFYTRLEHFWDWIELNAK